MILCLRLIFASARSALRSRRDLVLKILALRHQLAVLARSSRRPPLVFACDLPGAHCRASRGPT